jgi:hypothetical protein
LDRRGRRRRAEQAGEQPRQARGKRCGNDADAVEIGHGRQHAAGIVAEQPERGVALVAQEPAHHARGVAMIDAERAPGWPLADGADSVLLLDQPPVMLGAKAIDCLATCAGVTLATSRARPPIVAPERVEPLLMLGAVGAVGRELALAMLGILGISFPVLFVAESHIRPRHARVLTARRRAAGTQKAPGSRGETPRKRSEKRKACCGAVQYAPLSARTQARARDDVPNSGRCMAPPKRSDAIFDDGVSI